MSWKIARIPLSGLALAALAALAGCGESQLEDGYKYRPLNASSAERRAYYASPFSPEKAAAEQEDKQKNKLSVGP